MTLEDFANVEIIVLFVVAMQRRSTTENIYSCLLKWLSWKHTPCDMVRHTTLYVVSKYKLFQENPLSLFQIRPQGYKN